MHVHTLPPASALPASERGWSCRPHTSKSFTLDEYSSCCSICRVTAHETALQAFESQQTLQMTMISHCYSDGLTEGQ